MFEEDDEYLTEKDPQEKKSPEEKDWTVLDKRKLIIYSAIMETKFDE